MKYQRCHFYAQGARARMPRQKWQLTANGAVADPEPLELTTKEMLDRIRTLMTITRWHARQVLASGEHEYWEYHRETQRWTIL